MKVCNYKFDEEKLKVQLKKVGELTSIFLRNKLELKKLQQI